MYFFCLALFAAWMLPLQLPPWISWHKEVLVFVVLNLWAVGVFAKRAATLGWGPISLPMSIVFPLALIGVTILQYGAGLIVFSGDAIVLTLYFSFAAIALSLGFRTHRQTELVQAMAATFLVGGIFSAGIALAQSFSVWGDSPFVASLFSHRRPGANLAQANHLATFLLSSWASLIFLYLRGKVGKVTLAVATLWLFLGIALTESRTGLLSLSVMLGWCFIHRKSVCSKLPAAVLVAGALFYLVCLACWPAFLQWYWMDDAAGNASINVAAGARAVVWPQLWDAVLLKPWFGWGLLNVAGAHNAVLHNYNQGEAFSYAHNVVLDGVVGAGLPLTAMAFGMLIVWFIKRLRVPRDTVTWYCFAVAWPLCVHSMLEYPFAYSFLLFPVVVLLGVIESRARVSPPLNLPTWIGATFVVGVTVVGVGVIREYLLIEEDFRVARFEAQRLGQTDPEYQRPKVHLLTQLDAMLQVTRTVPDVNMSTEQIEMLRLATMRFPWSAIQNRYALSLALNGNPAEAARQLKVMRSLHGEGAFRAIQANWKELSKDKFPQLKDIQMPKTP